MRLPRLTIRWMMILVAVLAVASLIGRIYWNRQLRYFNPVSGSQLRATASDTPELAPGATVPVSITYLFQFNAFSKPTPGTTVTVLGSVWLEDQETSRYVDGYTFDAPLTVGERESAAGAFVWDALPPHPGRYMVRCNLYYSTPLGGFRGDFGHGTSHSFGVPNR